MEFIQRFNFWRIAPKYFIANRKAAGVHPEWAINASFLGVSSLNRTKVQQLIPEYFVVAAAPLCGIRVAYQ